MLLILHNATLCYFFVVFTKVLIGDPAVFQWPAVGRGLSPVYVPCILTGDSLDHSVPYLAGKDSFNNQTDEVHVYVGSNYFFLFMGCKVLRLCDCC